MGIVLDVADLVRGRRKEVQAVLHPLAKKGRPIPCSFVPHPRAKVICGHGGSPDRNHRRIWFPTYANGIQGQYHEMWYPRNGECEWWLERAYFSLRRIVRTIHQVEIILCIHSDPMCDDPDPAGLYKRGPHLHVDLAQSPLPDAHFPLNLGQLEEVLSSCDNLSQAMSRAIKIVRDEVIPRF